MMMSKQDKKVLFFDVDGTLVSEAKKDIPQSTVDALIRAMDRGHLVFVNSGRPRCMLDFLERLLPADGFLCGCGTQIVVRGESRFHRTIPARRREEIKRLILDCGLDGWLEGESGVWFREGETRMEQILLLKDTMRQDYELLLGWDREDCIFDKFCVLADEQSDRERFFASISDMDSIDRGNGMYECMPKGCSKATAMDWVLKEYGLPLENAYVFGDSTNDIPMFEFAPNRIAMGDHAPELDQFRPFVTKTVEEGGVAWAMEQLGII